MSRDNWGQTITLGPAMTIEELEAFREHVLEQRWFATDEIDTNDVEEYGSLLSHALGQQHATSIRRSHESNLQTNGAKILCILDCVDKLITDEQRANAILLFRREYDEYTISR